MMKKKSRWKSRWLGSAGAQSAGSSTDLDDFDRIKWKEEEEAATILNSILRQRQWRRSAHNRIGQLDDSLVMATAAASSPTTTSISMRRDSLIIDVNKSRKFFFFHWKGRDGRGAEKLHSWWRRAVVWKEEDQFNDTTTSQTGGRALPSSQGRKAFFFFY